MPHVAGSPPKRNACLSQNFAVRHPWLHRCGGKGPTWKGRPMCGGWSPRGATAWSHRDGLMGPPFDSHDAGVLEARSSGSQVKGSSTACQHLDLTSALERVFGKVSGILETCVNLNIDTLQMEGPSCLCSSTGDLSCCGRFLAWTILRLTGSQSPLTPGRRMRTICSCLTLCRTLFV